MFQTRDHQNERVTELEHTFLKMSSLSFLLLIEAYLTILILLQDCCKIGNVPSICRQFSPMKMTNVSYYLVQEMAIVGDHNQSTLEFFYKIIL